MAAIGMMIGGAVVNALAFTGCNYLFLIFEKSGEAEEEQKRHDLVLRRFSTQNQSINTSVSYGLIT